MSAPNSLDLQKTFGRNAGALLLHVTWAGLDRVTAAGHAEGAPTEYRGLCKVLSIAKDNPRRAGTTDLV